MEFKLFKCSNCNNETLMEIHARNKIEMVICLEILIIMMSK